MRGWGFEFAVTSAAPVGHSGEEGRRGGGGEGRGEEGRRGGGGEGRRGGGEEGEGQRRRGGRRRGKEGGAVYTYAV